MPPNVGRRTRDARVSLVEASTVLLLLLLRALAAAVLVVVALLGRPGVERLERRQQQAARELLRVRLPLCQLRRRQRHEAQQRGQQLGPSAQRRRHRRRHRSPPGHAALEQPRALRGQRARATLARRERRERAPLAALAAVGRGRREQLLPSLGLEQQHAPAHTRRLAPREAAIVGTRRAPSALLALLALAALAALAAARVACRERPQQLAERSRQPHPRRARAAARASLLYERCRRQHQLRALRQLLLLPPPLLLRLSLRIRPSRHRSDPVVQLADHLGEQRGCGDAAVVRRRLHRHVQRRAPLLTEARQEQPRHPRRQQLLCRQPHRAELLGGVQQRQ